MSCEDCRTELINNNEEYAAGVPDVDIVSDDIPFWYCTNPECRRD
ncbi:hypothetical protein LCGC14_0770240 [marine sediment metagenome]|uniref:Uncharacterized protein n=1 Tax=marine sediment metagenome TaxID=412755 RepID=A0A0F9Q2S2_9ZZZZ